MQIKKLSFLGTALNRSSLKSITGGIIVDPGSSTITCKNGKTVTCTGSNCSGTAEEGCSCSSDKPGQEKSCSNPDHWD
jgi:hypothetical protein